MASPAARGIASGLAKASETFLNQQNIRNERTDRRALLGQQQMNQTAVRLLEMAAIMPGDLQAELSQEYESNPQLQAIMTQGLGISGFNPFRVTNPTQEEQRQLDITRGNTAVFADPNSDTGFVRDLVGTNLGRSVPDPNARSGGGGLADLLNLAREPIPSPGVNLSPTAGANVPPDQTTAQAAAAITGAPPPPEPPAEITPDVADDSGLDLESQKRPDRPSKEKPSLKKAVEINKRARSLTGESVAQQAGKLAGAAVREAAPAASEFLQGFAEAPGAVGRGVVDAATSFFNETLSKEPDQFGHTLGDQQPGREGLYQYIGNNQWELVRPWTVDEIQQRAAQQQGARVGIPLVNRIGGI